MIKQHACPICQRLFVSIDRMELHKALVHREKSFKCATCDKQFVSAKSLSVHQRLHSDEYKCNLCAYVTTSKLYLRQHTRKHEGVKTSFSCDICQKCFAQKSSLLRHENLHLTNKGRSFRCSICGLYLRSRFELLSHMVGHTVVAPSYTCEICDKRFKSNRVLVAHVKSHFPTTVKFVCDICDKVFRKAYDLRVHKETHSSYKPNECFHCGKRFSYKNTLVRHIKKHYPRIRSDVVELTPCGSHRASTSSC